jgi:hypothetical protein
MNLTIRGLGETTIHLQIFVSATSCKKIQNVFMFLSEKMGITRRIRGFEKNLQP